MHRQWDVTYIEKKKSRALNASMCPILKNINMKEERKWPKNTQCASYINPKTMQNNTTYFYRWPHIK